MRKLILVGLAFTCMRSLAAVAGYVSSWRAARVHTMTALRYGWWAVLNLAKLVCL